MTLGDLRSGALRFNSQSYHFGFRKIEDGAGFELPEALEGIKQQVLNSYIDFKDKKQK